MIDNMTHKKYICEIGEKYAIMDESFQKFICEKPHAASNSWSAVQKPGTLTTERWCYSIKSIDTNNYFKHVRP